MKRGKVNALFLYCLVALFILIFSAFSASACPDNERIMRLYSQSNSHAALWNSPGYNIEICSPNQENVNHDCTNSILWMHGNSNSHVSLTKDSFYSTPICFGDSLVCRAINITEESCTSGETIVASLFSKYNSHTALGNFQDYKIKICCKPAGELSRAYWTDMHNTPINEANKNDLVKLVLGGEELTGNVNFTIYKEIPFAPDPVWFSKKIAIQSASGVNITWRAGKGTTTAEGDYYFIAELDNGDKINSQDNNEYGMLHVSAENNQAPFVRITTPEDRQIYFLNENLNFFQDTYDADDEFNYTWNLGDGEVKSGNSTNKINYKFKYAYTTPGQKDIILSVRDERGKISRAKSSILIVNSPYVLSYISKPAPWSRVKGFLIELDAKDSYAVDYSSTAGGEVTCLGGMCPVETKGCPPAKGTGCKLRVINAPNSYSNADYSKMNFTWNFFETLSSSLVIATATGKSEIPKFEFINPGEHLIKLNVSMTPSMSPSSSTASQIDIYYADQCEYDETKTVKMWWDSNGVKHNPVNEHGYCNCCTTEKGYACQDKICIQTVTEYASCEDYKKKTDCEADIDNKAGSGCTRNKIKLSEACRQALPTQSDGYITTDCTCYWNENDEKCVTNQRLTPQIVYKDEQPEDFTCTIERSTSECINGIMKLSERKFLFWEDETPDERQRLIRDACKDELCRDSDLEIACGDALVKLPFFTLTNIIIAILLLVVFYIIYSQSRHSRQNKKKKK